MGMDLPEVTPKEDYCPECGSTKVRVVFLKLECPTRGCCNFTLRQYMYSMSTIEQFEELEYPSYNMGYDTD